MPILIERWKPESTAIAGMIFLCITVAIALISMRILELGFAYAIIVIPAGSVALVLSMRLAIKPDNKLIGTKAFYSVSFIRMAISAGMLIDIYLRKWN
jgi:heme O synthase-like polyprenyltransferase